MYETVDPSARMQVRSLGQLVAPGSCMVCGSGTCDDGYLDLAVFIEYVGTAYLCKTCLYQAGETFGMYTPDEVKSQQNLIASLTEKNNALEEELTDARKHVDAANNLLHSRFTASGGTVTSISEDARPLVTINAEPAGEADSGEPVITEPTPLRRRGNPTGTQPRNPSL